mgnify:CR=1 FL=1
MEQPKGTNKVPKMEQLEEGQTYAWCSCGKSENQPWCNGAHQGSEFTPKVFKAEAYEKKAICTCKQTKNPPYCDGSHASLT